MFYYHCITHHAIILQVKCNKLKFKFKLEFCQSLCIYKFAKVHPLFGKFNTLTFINLLISHMLNDTDLSSTNEIHIRS